LGNYILRGDTNARTNNRPPPYEQTSGIVLWENLFPAANISATTYTLNTDTSNYNFLEIFFIFTSTKRLSTTSGKVPLTNNTTIIGAISYDYNYIRECTHTKGTDKVSINNCNYLSNGSSSVGSVTHILLPI
jgi:hypothetical protein